MREQQPVPCALCPSAPALYPLPLPLLCPLHLRRLAGPPSALLAAPSASPCPPRTSSRDVLVLPFLLGSTLLLFQLFWRPSLPSPFPLRPAPLAHAGVLVGEGGAIVVGLWLRLPGSGG